MPKRKRNSAGQNPTVRKLYKKLKKIENKLHSLDTTDSSSDTSSVETSESAIDSPEQPDDIPAVPTPVEAQDIDFDFFGAKPADNAQLGTPIHDELAVRWGTVLQNGLPTAQRNDLMGKFKIPENCLGLIPPKLNEEIQPCLPDGAAKHNKFITALQSQLAHGLSAIATVIGQTLAIEDQAPITKLLGEASQLLANVHNALSIHRKYRIIPYLHSDCAKVAKTQKMDDFLFGKGFHELFKTEQALKKSSAELKKRFPGKIRAGPSGQQQTTTQPLNYQRPYYRGRFKEKRGEEKSRPDRSKPLRSKSQGYHHRRT